ncbi:40S ribosomal protein S11-like [Gymnodraco acuticeps]|uniref:Small ribosomal subunit protein uS17 n=2 Tax=Notothenioidei TaxID=8205 RepID=A0A6P8UUD0_GYMAC|nr:40S ribosomal protein S11-like [Gymnodraco acuticeps]
MPYGNADAAIDGTYIDKKCPFTGNVSIRGRILSGVVTKMKMQRTIVIRRDYLHYIRKYNRFEKRHKNISVHLSPCFRFPCFPHQAIDGTYIDKKCPFTGNVSIRGRILSGVVTKMKMQRTIVIRRDYLHYIRKYNRFEKRHKNISVHLSPCFRDVSVGDNVTVGECRPLSKTVRFNVLKVMKAAGAKKQFQKF